MVYNPSNLDSNTNNFRMTKEQFEESHSRKVEAVQPGAGGVFTDLPKESQLIRREVREVKVPRWI